MWKKKDIVELNTTWFTQDIYLAWEMISDCNLNCEYCCATKEYKGMPLNLEFSDKVFQKILDITEDKTFLLRFFGGEPTLHPHLLQYLTKLKGKQVEIFTNFIKPLEFYLEMGTSGADICWQTSFHSYLPNWRSHIQKAKTLWESGVSVEVYVMMSPNITQQDIDLIINTYEETGVRYTFRNIKYNSSMYNIKRWETIDKNRRKDAEDFIITLNDGRKIPLSDEEVFIKYDITDFHFWKCDGGYRNLFIDFVGDVYPCQTHQLLKERKIGNILTDEIQLNHTMCYQRSCLCDTHLRKQKIFGR